MKIRNAVLSDLDFIVRANAEVNAESKLKPADISLKERLKNDFFPANKTRSNARIMIAEIDGAPVGMVVYSACYFMKEGDSIWVSNEYVDEKHRKSGVMTAMMNRLKEIAREENYNHICFLIDKDNTPSRDFAFKNGAKDVDNLRLFFIDTKKAE
ncbi:MAG: GNAT family N-acetyltransferase [Proteobacteria bacterium]|nr:GNAT family N-acetyltransferase [Pseudomonadota bacterium]